MPADRAGSWSNRDFLDEVPEKRHVLERGATAAVVTVVMFFLFLLAAQHEVANCGDACYDTGLRTFVRGHAWTAYEGSWQWQAQWVLGLLALVFGGVALATTTRLGLRRWTTGLLVASVASGALWGCWLLLEPAIPS